MLPVIEQFTALQLDKVLDYFEITEEKFNKLYEEGEVRVFPDFKTFFYWMHEDATTRELIDLLYNDTDYIGKNHLVLDDGNVVFIYE